MDVFFDGTSEVYPWTKREIFVGLKHLTETGELIIPASTLHEFCVRQLASLDQKDKTAKELKERKRAEDVLIKEVEAALSDEYEPISEIVLRIDDPEASVAKCVYRANKLVEQGKAESTEIEIPTGKGYRKRICKGFRRVQGID